jgi:hypothetical protein
MYVQSAQSVPIVTRLLAFWGFEPNRLAAGVRLVLLPAPSPTAPASATNHTHTPTPYPAVPPGQDAVTERVEQVYGRSLTLESGLLTHLTRLTRFSTSRHAFDFADTFKAKTIRLPNDPAALPSAGGSLRAIELEQDYEGRNYEHPRVCLEALLPVATGLESLDIAHSCLFPADAARLAAALPQEMAWLHLVPAVPDPRNDFGYAVLPVTSLGLSRLPDLNLLAGRTRLERLTVRSVSDAAPAALAGALQALPRLRMLQLGNLMEAVARKYAPSTHTHTPSGTATEPWDAFVAAAARLPSLRYLSLAGFYVGPEAKAALLEAAPRLSALRLADCGLSVEAAAGLAAQLRAAAGRGPLATGRPQPGNHFGRRGYFVEKPVDGTATPLDVRGA